METLHILNGDATAHPFNKSGIKGDKLIWREILSEGPAPGNLTGEEFWRVRYNYLGSTYKEREEELESKIGAELIQLEQFNDYSQVVLWFEHDLVCQVNLIYLLNYFANRPLGTTQLSMVSINRHPEVPDFKGLGELTGEQLAKLYENKTIITGSHLQTAKRAWKAYSSSDPRELEALLQSDLSALPFLSNAMQMHLLRFPSYDNGLNRIEERILNIALEPTPSYEKEKVHQKFYETESIFGLGDLQIENYMHTLSPALLNTRFTIETTEKGRQVLFNNDRYYPADRWLGGVHISTEGARWYYNRSSKHFIKEEQ